MSLSYHVNYLKLQFYAHFIKSRQVQVINETFIRATREGVKIMKIYNKNNRIYSNIFILAHPRLLPSVFYCFYIFK